MNAADAAYARRAFLKRLRDAGAAATCLAWPGVAMRPTMAAEAAPPEVSATWPAARLRGAGELRFLGLKIADARLWSETAFIAEDYARTPLALELRYRRGLSGARIAARSIDEMEHIGTVPENERGHWQTAMAHLFPDVSDGDRITGLLLPPATARFAFNGRVTGELEDAEFARLFFGIWLSPRTSEPGLRARLLGLAA